MKLLSPKSLTCAISVFNVSASGVGTFEMALSVRCYGAVARLFSKILTHKNVTSQNMVVGVSTT